MTASASVVTERIVGHGAAAFEAARERLAALASCDDAALVIPTRVTLQPGDVVAVTERAHAGLTLRRVLDARGSLRAGECVWWASRAASALAGLHARGLAHGAIDADAVVIADGAVLLTRLVDAVPNVGAADDIRALGDLLAAAVRDDDAPRVRAWTEPMTDGDEAGRPTAAMVARALASCAPEEPVRLPATGVAGAMRRTAAGASEGVEVLPEGRWWRAWVRWRRRLVWAGAGLAVVALAAVVVGAAAGGGEAASPVGGARAEAAHAAGASHRPAEAAAWLTAERMRAMMAADPEALVALTVPGSAASVAAVRDADLLAAGRLVLAADGKGAPTTPPAVRVSEAPPRAPEQGDTATVTIDYEVPAHTSTLDGAATARPATLESVVLTLVWDDATGWAVAQAASASSAT